MQDHKVIIDPKVSDAKELREWLQYQGDMRGFLCHEDDGKEYLIVFDSYGHTHSSMCHLLGINIRRAKNIWTDSLIFQKNGKVTNCDAVVTEGEVIDHPVIRAIYYPTTPTWTNGE